MPAENNPEDQRQEARLRAVRDHMMFIKMGGPRAVEFERGMWVGRIRHCQKLLNIPLTPFCELRELGFHELDKRGDKLVLHR